MKTISLIALALCGFAIAFAIACHREDTDARAGWLRGVQPRVVGAAWQPCEKVGLGEEDRVVPEYRCGASAPAAQSCTANLDTLDGAADAIRRPECTKDAIATLELFAKTNSAAAVDLAAAYYVRAQRENRPTDLLRALRTAQEALNARPDSPELRFNLALSQEAIGLFDEARRSWQGYLSIERDASWSAEAREHLAALPKDPDESEAERGARARAPMLAALRANDAAALERAIAAFPQTAQRYLDEGLLADWAKDPSPENLELARRMAEGLSRRSGDRFPLAEIDAIVRAASSPEKTKALRAGHLAYAEARNGGRATYEDASRDFARGDSPARWMAEARAAASLDPEVTLARTDALIAETKKRDYLAPLGISQGMRAFAFESLSRYVESLNAYEEQAATARRRRDTEDALAIRSRRNGQLGRLGDYEAAWREVLPALLARHQIVSANDRHAILGQASVTAQQLDYPEVAFVYQEAAVRFTRYVDEAQFATALREHARIEAKLGRRKQAEDDLRESFRLAKNSGPAAQESLESRLLEVQGQVLLNAEPLRAKDFFSMALAKAGNETRTYRADLFLQRARAFLRANRTAEANDDLREAIAVLQREQTENLAHRTPGDAEELWSPYFSRFQDTYRLLIARQLAEGRPEEAFRFSEQARATEPFDLAVRRGVASPDLRGLTVAQIQSRLPPNTYLLEYCVFDDRTYVWLLSRDHFDGTWLKASKSDILRWTDDVQRAAQMHELRDFEVRVSAPYKGLLRQPLAMIDNLQPRVPPHLVIVADDAIHGLPIAALQSSKGQPYVVEQTASIVAEGSAALYLSALERDRLLGSAKPASILLVGDPAFDRHAPTLQNYGRRWTTSP